MSTLRGFAALLLVVAVLPSTALAAEQGAQWPGFRGPTQSPEGVFPQGDFGLSVEWKRSLGSGYSSFAVAGDRVITQFTDGDADVLAAFRDGDGGELWRYRIDNKYAGHDGSDDGPLATPTVAGDRVITLGANGQLVAVSLADGSELWRVELDEESSNVPFYGYTASPLVTDGLVILTTGGDGRAVTAFDLETGAVRWSQGDDTVTYQTPILAELDGRRQLVAVTDQWAFGMVPDDGEILWRFRHSEGDERQTSAHPTVLDDRHILVTVGDGSLALEVSGGGTQVKEAWRSRAFGNALVLPVVHDGHIYGFTGRILTCADAATGEIRWRSRGASAFNLSLVDGHLVILSRGEGEAVVVEANPEEYVEKARLPLFDRGDYADAAYADGRFFVRNLTHMASFRVDRGAAPGIAQAAADPNRIRGSLGALVKEIEGMPKAQRQAKVDAFFEGRSLPLVETTEGGAGLAHIVHRGEVEDVAVSGVFLGRDGGQVTLHRVDGTDLFYRSFELDPGGQWEYQLSIDYGQAGPDPANPFPEVDEGFGRFSELRMPQWTPSPHLEAPAAGEPRGTLDSFQFTSEILENTRRIQVWMPPGYGGDARYPVLVMNHGDRAVRGGLMVNVLDNVVGQSVAPVLVVFVPRAHGPEYGGDRAADYTRFLTEELLPHVDRHYRTLPEPRGIMGPGSGATASILGAMQAPGTFQRVAAQSFYVVEEMREPLFGMIAAADSRPEMVYIEQSRNDYVIPANGIDAGRDSKDLAEALRKQGFRVVEDSVGGAAGWSSWRGQTHRLLEALFPAEAGEG
ncbi:MAG: PQQ-binding-like beta-propeller repeat protein [Acidobacteriota bacterium]